MSFNCPICEEEITLRDVEEGTEIVEDGEMAHKSCVERARLRHG